MCPAIVVDVATAFLFPILLNSESTGVLGHYLARVYLLAGERILVSSHDVGVWEVCR